MEGLLLDPEMQGLVAEELRSSDPLSHGCCQICLEWVTHQKARPWVRVDRLAAAFPESLYVQQNTGKLVVHGTPTAELMKERILLLCAETRAKLRWTHGGITHHCVDASDILSKYSTFHSPELRRPKHVQPAKTCLGLLRNQYPVDGFPPGGIRVPVCKLPEFIGLSRLNNETLSNPDRISADVLQQCALKAK